jgi:hypothetical protein
MWKVFYSDGSTFSHADGEPHEAPPEGVLCIVAYDRHGKRYIAFGQPFFCFDVETGEWWPVDLAGLLDRLRRNLIYAFKEGRSVDNEQFQAAMQRAHEDPEFPMR